MCGNECVEMSQCECKDGVPNAKVTVRETFARQVFAVVIIRVHHAKIKWTSHVTCMNESSHVYERVMSHIHERDMSHILYMNESSHIYAQIMIVAHHTQHFER